MYKKLISGLLLLSFLAGNMSFSAEIPKKESSVAQNTQSAEKTLTKEEVKKLVSKYYDDILKIIKKEKAEIFYDEIDQNLLVRRYKYTQKDDSDERLAYHSGRIVKPLCDGDYVVWNSKALADNKLINKDGQYAIEYHNDGSAFGLIKIKKISKNKYAFYEYRINEPENGVLKLKHILVYYNSKEPAMFVATTDGSIKSLAYKGKIVFTNLSNLADINNQDLTILDQNLNIADDAVQIAATGALAVSGLALMPIAIPGVILMYFVVIPFGEILSAITSDKNSSENDNK